MKAENNNIWIKTSDRSPRDFGFEVIGFNEKWIDEDFNPNGTRVCVYGDMGWMIARWDPSDDFWVTDYTEDEYCQSEPPTHWMFIPEKPAII